MFTFKKITNELFFEKTSGYTIAGDWVYDVGEAGDKEFALFWGKLITLFGEPNDKSGSWEEMYNYFIEADDGKKKYYVTVYHGSGGSSIAMPTNTDDRADYELLKKELIGLIEHTAPTDYEWESVYEDVPANIKYTVKDGKAYVKSEFCKDMF